jgi:hypothetical protein
MPLAGSLLTLLVAACGSGSGQDAEAPAQAALVAPAAQEALTTDHWRVQVSVKPSRLGPIVFSAQHPARAKPTDSHPWIVHDLVFRNTGDRPVSFADTRGSEFVGEAGHNRLLVADQGCGYARNSPRAPVRTGVCAAYLDLLVVKPHASAGRSITLFKGLPGMAHLTPGTYVFRRPVRFQSGKRQPGEGKGRSGVVRLVYRIASGSGA